MDALSLDHVLNNGSEERRRLGSQDKVYRRAVKTYLPDEYRTLCLNCQRLEYRRNSKGVPSSPEEISEFVRKISEGYREMLELKRQRTLVRMVRVADLCK